MAALYAIYYSYHLLSPNGDGLNDVFPHCSFGDDEVSNYQIYNRWGAGFEAGSDTAWDGTTDGKKQKTGVYIYYITIACEGSAGCLFQVTSPYSINM